MPDDLSGVAAELLAEGNRSGVHQVGTTAFDHFGELFGLLVERASR